MRKRLAGLLLISLLSMSTAIADIQYQGHAEFDDQFSEPDKELFTGKKETLEKKDIIEMTVSQVLDGSFSLEGDEFFAEVTSDVIGDKGVIIPKGTVAHGTITQTSEAKRLGRDGHLSLSFDYLVTPDGREIPIEGKMSTKLHPLKAATKIIATDVGYTAVGGVAGGLFAIQALGLEAAIASQGYTVAGGAAIGELPVYRDEALKQKEVKYPGLDIRIANILYEKDPFGEVNTITLSLSISNMSKKAFSGMDLALMNDYNAVYNPSIFGDTKLLFSQLKPGDRFAGRISFSVNNVKQSFWLVVNDRATNKPLAKISLDNAYKNVSKDVKKRNDKMRKGKKNYYKEESPFDI